MDDREKKYILKWELAGVVFVFLLGALLHFLFEWSGESGFAGGVCLCKRERLGALQAGILAYVPLRFNRIQVRS